ncbi:MAG: HlyD family efflux transporter periplasmic adaptor subunit [Candidatus Pacebacteria bacterium]|nr:HlyD family efflux transporter periplasmic adaptor subunit [Candidatus Paceibacterota bacterium]MCF7862817.1 HlyD family efflux transporter periplasmic adaptor subunit [Candidatus Paceibacterota bacterium]
MKKKFFTLKNWVLAHKKIAILILVVFIGLIFGGFKIFGNNAEDPRYVLAIAKKSDLVTTINGTGQVSASNQVDVVSKVSGEVLYLNAKSGQEVKNGQLLAQVDSGDAKYDLETARLSYDDLVTVDADELRDTENALEQAVLDLESSYLDARSKLSSAVTDINDVMSGVDDLFSGYLSTSNNFNLSRAEKDYIDRAEQFWYSADRLLNTFSKKYRTLSITAKDEDIESNLVELNSIVNSIVEATKYAKDAVVYRRDTADNTSTSADTAYLDVNDLLTKINTTASNVLSARNSILNNKKNVDNKKYDLKKLKDGPDTLSLREKELSVRQKQNTYADYFIRASFDGIIASVNATKGQNVSNGTNIVTLITKQKIAEISLNEIDVAKVEVGQKATLSFDALEELKLDGEVIEVDLVGTTTQGVVNYKVKIGFNSDNEKIKTGMTVSADIVTSKKESVINVPISAVKTQNNRSFIEIVDPAIEITRENQVVGSVLSTLPKRTPVTVGSQNEDSIEIVSGLDEGQMYVVRMIVSSLTTTTNQNSSLFGGNIRTGTGGATRNFQR